MKLSIREPKQHALERSFARARALQPTPDLPAAALDRSAASPGYRFGQTREMVGSGSDDFDHARRVIGDWSFLPRWVHAYPPNAPQVPGETVLLAARTLGVWAILPARIIETIESPTSSGFVYAALPGHVAFGIERFVVEHDPETGRVEFSLTAVAHPAYLLIRLGRPGFTFMQRTFRRACMRRMRAEIRRATITEEQ